MIYTCPGCGKRSFETNGVCNWCDTCWAKIEPKVRELREAWFSSLYEKLAQTK